MWQSEVMEQMGIDVPFVGAGMAIVGGPALTAGVSNAGGLGLFCLGPGTPELLGTSIDQIRQLTDRPFGVDFIVEDTSFGPATTEAHIDVVVEKKVPLVVFFWNPPPAEWVAKIRESGAKIWGTAYSVESALKLEELGVDAIIVQTNEAGGHVKATLGALSLIPATVAALNGTPVIAAGGIVDGPTAAAAFALGADAVCVGTRLVASVESLASDEYKERLLQAKSGETTVTTIFGPEWPDAPMRVIRNAAVAQSERGEGVPEGVIGKTLVFGQEYDMPACSAILPTLNTKGDHEAMCIAAGAGVGSITSVKTAAEIVSDVIDGAREAMRASAGRVS